MVRSQINPGSLRHRRILNAVSAALREDPDFGLVRKVLVGLSGGVDSVVLLHLFCAYRDRGGPEVVAAHVHHGLRGKEADRDAKVAEKVARRHECDFHVLHIAKKFLKSKAEHSLREARLSLLQRLAFSVGAERIALAHQQDDLAETVLFRLLGGSDLRGLAGIRFFRPPVWIRPLLNVSRQEIVKEAESCRLPYVEDSTNRETDRGRNFLRRIVIPMLEAEFNPQLSRHLVALAQSMKNVSDYLESEAQALLRRARARDGSFKVSILRAAPTALLRVAIEAAFRDVAGEGAALRRPQLAALERLVFTPGRLRTFSLPRGVTVVREADRIELLRSIERSGASVLR